MYILREFGNYEVVVIVISSSSFSYHVDTRSEEREQYDIICLYLKSLSAFFSIQVCKHQNNLQGFSPASVLALF